jgi:hypothetical protein
LTDATTGSTDTGAPEADTDAISALHCASIEPSEGRSDISSADTSSNETSSTNDENEPLTEAESDTTLDPTSESGGSSNRAIPSNDEDQPLTEAESDTTADPTSEFGGSSNRANPSDDAGLSEGDTSAEDEEGTTSHAHRSRRGTRHYTHHEDSTEETSSDTTPATSEGN